ncbi:MAG TPA: sigma-70 family RNA polymerase sigma factor, partial [Planctomycetota bacterium]|nr:sigma-70 family RNA polymerase sigma factor [Planctomycetota bacterium]
MSSASPSLDPGALLAHAEWVRALARRLVRDADLADDVAQSAWVAAIETPPAADRSPRRWLAAVLRSRAIDVRRAAARALRRERAIARPEAMPSTVEIVDRLSTHRAVVEAVLSLDEPYRGVILLRFFENLSARAIAARSGVPIATVRTRIARALAKLRVRLDRTHGGDRSAWMAALAPLGAREGIFWAAIGGGVVKAKGIVVAAAAALLLAVGWLLTSSTGSEPGATPALGKSQAPAAPSAVAALATKEGESARGVAASPSPRPHEGPSDPVASREGSAGSRVLRGRVVDLDSRALAGVALRFRGRTSKGGAAEPEETVAVSDAAGRFEMARPALAGELEVASPRYTTVFACFVDPNVSTEALIVAGARITVAGSVVDAAGAPVPDAKVSIQLPPSFRAAFREVLDLSPDRVWWSTTDGAGRFEIADTAYVPGARLAASAGSFESTSVDAPQTSTWSVVLRLAKPDARKGWIRGRVVDLAGRPVASAWVGPNVGAPAQTDVDGRFDLQLGVGTSATISAAKEGHLPAMRELRTDAEGRLDPPEDLVLRLGDKPLEIAGTVVDATGAPVANAPVWIVGGAERNW